MAKHDKEAHKVTFSLFYRGKEVRRFETYVWFFKDKVVKCVSLSEANITGLTLPFKESDTDAVSKLQEKR